MRSIYIHLPFCAQKCRYCDFLSDAADYKTQERYIGALLQEMKERVLPYWQRPDTLFIGGGTPSFLAPDLWSILLEGIHRYIMPMSATEWSIEANPQSGHKDLFQLWQEAGVNRLSLGVQSFCNDELKLLGRVHHAEEAMKAYQEARRAGFDNINLDLMYGLPGQSLQRWQTTVETALELAPEHLSLYGLILEEGTPLTAAVEAGRLPEPSDRMAAEALQWHTERLAMAGYEVYEISNYAKPGHTCCHNQAYWALTPWLGLGLGATGRKGREVTVMTDDMLAYCDTAEKEHPWPIKKTFLTAETLMADAMLMGLRQAKGVQRKDLQTRYGFDFESLWEVSIAKGCAAGLLDYDGETLRLTRQGRLHGNDCFMMFLTPERS